VRVPQQTYPALIRDLVLAPHIPSGIAKSTATLPESAFSCCVLPDAVSALGGRVLPNVEHSFELTGVGFLTSRKTIHGIFASSTFLGWFLVFQGAKWTGLDLPVAVKKYEVA
jgi:hypothetical protein